MNIYLINLIIIFLVIWARSSDVRLFKVRPT